MHPLIAAGVFYILSVLLFPVTLLGYVIWTGSLLVRRGSGVSATAQGPLSARWFEHHLGTRKDEPADRLIPPGENHTLGQETEGKRAWGGFATAVVK
jgi:hypothetical protein